MLARWPSSATLEVPALAMVTVCARCWHDRVEDAVMRDAGRDRRGMADPPHRSSGSFEGVRNCRDRATALIEDIWCENASYSIAMPP